MPLPQFVNVVHGNGGLCIAAHVGSNNGLRRLFRMTARDQLRLFDREKDESTEVPVPLLEYMHDAGLDAIGIAKASEHKYYSWTSTKDGQKRTIATTLSFDSHSIEGLARSDRLTYMKMTALGFQGLQEALLFPETRIRFPDDLPAPPPSKLIGLRVESAEGGLFRDATIAFSENLTCLIGPRGSGKSTLVECLRYVLGQNSELQPLGSLGVSARELQSANLQGARIRLLYERADEVREVLESTFDPKSDYATKVFSLEGEYQDVDNVHESGQYPARVFGWSEIESLGRDPSRQREMLDRLVPELEGVLGDRAALEGRLGLNRVEIQEVVEGLAAALEADNGAIFNYSEFKADFESLNTEEVQALFATLDLAHGKRAVLQRIRNNIDNQAGALRRLEDSRIDDGVDALLEDAGDDLKAWGLTDLPTVLNLSAKQGEVKANILVAIERLDEVARVVDARLADVDAEAAAVRDELREKFAGDAEKLRVVDLRSGAEKRLQRASAARSVYLQWLSRLDELLLERWGISEELVALHERISTIRARNANKLQEQLQDLLPEDLDVGIDFAIDGDVDDAVAVDAGIFKGVSAHKKRGLRGALHSLSPLDPSKRLVERRLEELESLQVPGEESAINAAELGKMQENLTVFQVDESCECRTLTDDGSVLLKVLAIGEARWDDYEVVQLRGRPVSELSPGQRSSVMLPLIALSGEDAPLIIDQPEDNLDKRLIGNILVRVLASLKQRRQIIVCTHDPNILVGGDAEQVVVLEPVDDRESRIDTSGSIDNDEIVETVVDLLEGGAEAFANRRKRYSAQGAIGE